MKACTTAQINDFINDGFVRIENAFSTELADECRAILWAKSGCDPNRPETWSAPVIRVGDIDLPSFRKAANTPLLLSAFDQLAGEGNWLPRTSLGSFPIRFPAATAAADTGWHVDASFPGEDSTDFLEWRVNLFSKGRVLLMLFLFSDVSETDAPTRIRVGSHLDVAKILQPAGEKGLSFMELAQRLGVTKDRKEALATGKAGTVYLCHPFLVHAAQDHHGRTPKFMAQPPLLPAKGFRLDRNDQNLSPVEIAILKGLE